MGVIAANNVTLEADLPVSVLFPNNVEILLKELNLPKNAQKSFRSFGFRGSLTF